MPAPHTAHTVKSLADEFAEFMGVEKGSCPACTSEAYDANEGNCFDCGLSVADFLDGDTLDEGGWMNSNCF